MSPTLTSTQEKDIFERQAYERCDARYTFFLAPSADSWELDDREVACLQESFGLSVTDPAKLDRLIGLDRLNVGACFNEARETGGLLVERVDCSGAWESRVVGSFQVTDADQYPGEGYFERQAYEKMRR